MTPAELITGILTLVALAFLVMIMAGGVGDWSSWFAHAGQPRLEPLGGRLTFSFIDQAMQAAIRWRISAGMPVSRRLPLRKVLFMVPISSPKKYLLPRR